MPKARDAVLASAHFLRDLRVFLCGLMVFVVCYGFWIFGVDSVWDLIYFLGKKSINEYYKQVIGGFVKILLCFIVLFLVRRYFLGEKVLNTPAKELLKVDLDERVSFWLCIPLIMLVSVPVSWLISAGLDGVVLDNYGVRWGLIVGSVFVVFAAACAEEVMYRGILMRFMIKKEVSLLLANLLQATIFSLGHGGWSGLAAQRFVWFFFAGFLLGGVFVKYGSILRVAVVHCGLNLLFAQVSPNGMWFAGIGRIEVHGDWESVYRRILGALVVIGVFEMAGAKIFDSQRQNVRVAG